MAEVPAERLLNMERALDVLASHNVDILIGATPENSFYATGFKSLFQWLVRGRKTNVFGVLTRAGEVSLIAPSIELDQAAVSPPPVDRIVGFDAMTLDLGVEDLWTEEDRRLAGLATGQQPAEAIEALRSVVPLESKRVAIDDHDLALSLGELGVDVIDARTLFSQIRLIKTPEEVKRLRRAVEITEAAITATIQAAHVGIREDELGSVFEHTLVDHGARPYQTIIGFGNQAGHPSHIPGARELREGDLIRWDVGCEYKGYVSDIARVAIVGEATEEQTSKWSAVLKGQEELMAAVAPGRAAEELFAIGVAATRAAGLPRFERKHVGHGIGIDMYEQPLLAPGNSIQLEPGMVADIEVPYYELGFGAMQLEDCVHITDQGYEVFNELPYELFQIGV